MLRFLCAGTWSESQVDLQSVPSRRKIVPAVEQAIQSAWTTAMARPGVHLFDGPMCRLESWEKNRDRLSLQVSKTSYKIFMGTNMSHPQFAAKIGPDVMANPVGVSPALLTSDGKLLLGRRNSRVAYYPERVHPFSGSLEPDEKNLFAAVLRELHEELSLKSSDISELFCTGIVEDQNLLQPELIFAVKTSRSHYEVEAMLDAKEHQAMIAIDANAASIEQAVTDPKLTPVAVGTLLLWGRCNLGQPWFDQASPQ